VQLVGPVERDCDTAYPPFLKLGADDLGAEGAIVAATQGLVAESDGRCRRDFKVAAVGRVDVGAAQREAPVEVYPRVERFSGRVGRAVCAPLGVGIYQVRVVEA